MFDNFRFTIECGFSINIIESNNRCLINIVSNSNTYNIPVTNCNSLNKYILYNIQGYQLRMKYLIIIQEILISETKI